MSTRNPTNVAASVRAKLTTYGKTTGRPFQEVLQYFAMERFLSRLSVSEHVDKFILKGGLMFAVWNTSHTRPTKDIDFLANMPNDVETAANVVKEIAFIEDGTDYEGVRVTLKGHLDSAKIHLQIDMGFGDVVAPGPLMLDYPTIPDHAPPKLRGYPAETVVAEKFETMVKLGQLNSRIRDFYDVWSVSKQFEFNGATLQKAIAGTFSHRDTDVESDPVAFQPVFIEDGTKQSQWKGFCRKSKIESAPESLPQMIVEISDFLTPVAESIVDQKPFNKTWKLGGPWQA